MKSRAEILREIFSTMSLSHRQMHVLLQRALSKGDLTVSQMHQLSLIQHSEPISLKTLADRMQLTPGAVTQIVDALEKIGYVERKQDEHDRRVTNISLSPVGTQKLAGFKKTSQQVFRRASRSLSEHELETFLKAQQKMLAYFESQNEKEKG